MLLNEHDLLIYLEYWGGNTDQLKDTSAGKVYGKRANMAATFYLLHYPKRMWDLPLFWQANIKQFLTWFHSSRVGDNFIEISFRNERLYLYFRQIYDYWVKIYGVRQVFRFRYQNWNYLVCRSLVDMLNVFTCKLSEEQWNYLLS